MYCSLSKYLNDITNTILTVYLLPQFILKRLAVGCWSQRRQYNVSRVKAQVHNCLYCVQVTGREENCFDRISVKYLLKRDMKNTETQKQKIKVKIKKFNSPRLNFPTRQNHPNLTKKTKNYLWINNASIKIHLDLLCVTYWISVIFSSSYRLEFWYFCQIHIVLRIAKVKGYI